MKKIFFIFSLFLMIGMQVQAQITPYYFDGYQVDIIYQDPTKELHHTFTSRILPIYCAFVTPVVENGYTKSMTISDVEIERLYNHNKDKGYYDLPVQAEINGQIYNCYVRIQFIKK